jgi:pSer/pThr/pTyr-binding forkhead associated (FHA) protein
MEILLLALRILLALLLYAFLAAVVIMLWRDLRQQEGRADALKPKGRAVVVESSDELLLPVGTVLALQPVTSIGRAAGNTICVPDAYASAHHALLTWREGQWHLEDRASRNGTLLNESRIGHATVVREGDIVGIGQTKLRLELE